MWRGKRGELSLGGIGGSSQRPHSTADGPVLIERRGEQNRAEGRGLGRERTRLVSGQTVNGKALSVVHTRLGERPADRERRASELSHRPHISYNRVLSMVPVTE